VQNANRFHDIVGQETQYMGDTATQFSRLPPWSPSGSSSTGGSRQKELFSPSIKGSSHQGYDGRFTQTTKKPFHRIYNEFPVATSDPNRMRDMGVEKGNSYSGGPTKYAYRLTSPNHMLATSVMNEGS